MMKFFDYILSLVLARSTEVGARTLVHASLWGTKEEVNGRFLRSCELKAESDFVLSEEGKKVEGNLWVYPSNLLMHVVTDT